MRWKFFSKWRRYIEEKLCTQTGVKNKCLWRIVLIERLPVERRQIEAYGVALLGMICLVFLLKQLHLEGEVVERKSKCNKAICDVQAIHSRKNCAGSLRVSVDIKIEYTCVNSKSVVNLIRAFHV